MSLLNDPQLDPIGPQPAKGMSYFELKNSIQQKVVSQLDQSMDINKTDEVRRTIQELFEQILVEENLVMSRPERARLFEQIAAEILGFGPLQSLLEDDTITEIIVNGPNNVYVERKGVMHRVPVTFSDNDHLLRVIERIALPLARRIDEANPYLSARLPDGSRVNAIVSPFSLGATTLIIRKFSRSPLTVDKLISSGSISWSLIYFLKSCVETELNIIITGDEGSGKTTLLNVLSSFILGDHRIVTVEQTAELQLRQEHVITMEVVPANLDGHNSVGITKLLDVALRLRPDCIVLGEITQETFLSTMHIMNSISFLSTMPGSSCRDCLDRLIFFAAEQYRGENQDALSRRVLAGIDVLIHCSIGLEGKRRVDEVAVLEGKGDRQLIPVFRINSDGNLAPTGKIPHEIVAHFHGYAIDTPETLFDPQSAR